ncbi:MAG: hypothetical protein MZV49_04345 [Rhodopseudomonas palustris]|nr:hypothetical protein [Rhodopseudomonas palustris]
MRRRGASFDHGEMLARYSPNSAEHAARLSSKATHAPASWRLDPSPVGLQRSATSLEG